MEEKRGGKRVGAGRKPIAEKKVAITLYVKGGKVLEFGSIEKTKENIYNYLEGTYESETQNEVYDFTKPTNVIKPFEQPKTNYSVNTLPKKEVPSLSEFDAFKDAVLKTERIEQIEEIMTKVKSSLMFPKQKILIEQIAKEHSKNFYTD